MRRDALVDSARSMQSMLVDVDDDAGGGGAANMMPAVASQPMLPGMAVGVVITGGNNSRSMLSRRGSAGAVTAADRGRSSRPSRFSASQHLSARTSPVGSGMSGGGPRQQQQRRQSQQPRSSPTGSAASVAAGRVAAPDATGAGGADDNTWGWAPHAPPAPPATAAKAAAAGAAFHPARLLLPRHVSVPAASALPPRPITAVDAKHVASAARFSEYATARRRLVSPGYDGSATSNPGGDAGTPGFRSPAGAGGSAAASASDRRVRPSPYDALHLTAESGVASGQEASVSSWAVTHVAPQY